MKSEAKADTNTAADCAIYLSLQHLQYAGVSCYVGYTQLHSSYSYWHEMHASSAAGLLNVTYVTALVEVQ